MIIKIFETLAFFPFLCLELCFGSLNVDYGHIPVKKPLLRLRVRRENNVGTIYARILKCF